MITITAKTEGFRRGGIAHSKTPVEYPDDAFTAEQLAELLAEPLLIVDLSDKSDKSDKSKKGKR